MRRALAGAVLAVALAATPASGATLNELPFQPLPDRHAAGCLRATGAPGGVALFGRPSAADLWHAGAAGLQRRERVSLGRLSECAAVAEAGGAAVVAGRLADDGEVRAVVRDAGGAFSAPVRLGTGEGVAAAMAPAGHAVVAWFQRRGRRVRVMVARREPGGTFGPADALIGWWAGESFVDPAPAVGIDATGTATVVWTREPDVRARRPRHRLYAAVAASGGAFVRHRLGAPEGFSHAPAAVAVAPDGWTVVAHVASQGVTVLERAPSAARFTRTEVLTPRGLEEIHDVAVAVRDGGGALVAWRAGFDEERAGVAAVSRAGPGALTAPEVVSPAAESSFGNSVVFVELAPPPTDRDAGRLRAALGPGGRALLAWTRDAPDVKPARARVAAGLLGGTFDEPQAASAPLREADDVVPVFLADGRAAAAWTDNASLRLTPAFETRGRPDGRLHLAAEGVKAPVEEAPRLALRVARRQRLFRAEPIRLTARCDRPCDVLAGSSGEVVSATLRGAGGRRLGISEEPFGRRRPGVHHVTVHVLASAPGGRAVVRRRVRVRIVPRPSLPLRAPLDVRARRRGGAILVRWRTAGPARRMSFSVLGQSGRGPATYVPLAAKFVPGRGRTHFAVRLRPERPRLVRWVAVYAGSLDGGGSRVIVVRVR